MRFTSVNLLLLFTISYGINSAGQKADPLYHWDLEKITGRTVTEQMAGTADTLEGNYSPVKGVSGNAIRLDGYTTVICNKGREVSITTGSVTTEAWIALGAYPWNWCPVVAQRSRVSGGKKANGGFSMEVGPRGELGLKIFIEGNEILCVSEKFALGLFEWMHVAATFQEGSGLKIYINGQPAGSHDLKGGANYSPNNQIRIGMNDHPVNPSNLIGEAGYKPFWYSIDGIIDEVKIYNSALSGDYFKEQVTSQKPKEAPELPERKLPFVTQDHPSFGAYYTKLKYYKEWDQLWPVASDPDIVVTFKESPVKMVFWRGTRYSPAWVTDNNLWMTDQSVESWNDEEGCLEHMQDRHCRYSHVRMIEDNDARKVIHWRYAPVSAYNDLWNEDPKTGWAVWIDEYYYIYPDATAIRKATWKTGAMGRPVQFQESMPLTGPGQTRGDVMEIAYLKIANMDGDTLQLLYRENPTAIDKGRIPEAPNIQQHNFKSDYDPFIIFEPGNKMQYIMDRDIKNLLTPGTCNHWPVGQANCDGRVTQASDRPASFLGFPISDPIIHDDDDGRSYHSSIYGMVDRPMEDLVQMAGSWVNAPELILHPNQKSIGAQYDRSQKAYIVKSETGHVDGIKASIPCTETSPLFNPAMVIEGWGEAVPEILLNGKKLKPGDDFSFGHRKNLNSTSLILWIKLRSTKPQELEIHQLSYTEGDTSR